MLKPCIAIATAIVLLFQPIPPDEKIISPEKPVLETKAPSDKVINGTVFESGFLSPVPGATVVLPTGSVVEYYDGSTIGFFLTKSMRCSGHPPVSMKIRDVRAYFGIAARTSDRLLEVATFGEWANRGGTAAVKLLVLVPKNIKVEYRENLRGPQSLASTEMRFDDPALKQNYWYAGTGPKDSWARIQTELHHNRFVKP